MNLKKRIKKIIAFCIAFYILLRIIICQEPYDLPKNR